jgi:hypothetical protein
MNPFIFYYINFFQLFVRTQFIRNKRQKKFALSYKEKKIYNIGSFD